MVLGITNPRPPTKEKGQRSKDLPAFLRVLPAWSSPAWINADRWRLVVRDQSIAMICRETLIANIMALDWKITPKDSNLQDELKKEIEYYTNLIKGDGGIDYSLHTEWVGQDFLDLPFGAGTELGREGDQVDGKVVWFEPLDGATLFPTLNKDWPVGQRLKELPLNPVYFPEHAMDRIYMTPRTNIRHKGWGMPPPEKIYLAITMLWRGDRYYANLLLDTPEAGILDLMDMDEESARAWIKGFQDLMSGIDPFKIPVLYEHTKEAKFIPFGKPPTDLMYDRITLRVAAIICAGYGLTLSDIGFPTLGSGGETLAGTIRGERQTRKTGFARLKRKFVEYWGKMLPETLQFEYIDHDDELSVALGRARLATMTAFNQMIESRVLLPEEARMQMLSDGLITIAIPEKLPEGAFDEIDERKAQKVKEAQERPGSLGAPVSPSQGGHGEIKRSERNKNAEKFKGEFHFNMENVHPARIRKLVKLAFTELYLSVNLAVTSLAGNQNAISMWNDWHNKVLFGQADEEAPDLIKQSIRNIRSKMSKLMNKDKWWMPRFSDSMVQLNVESFYREHRWKSMQAEAVKLYEEDKRDSPEISGEHDVYGEIVPSDKMLKSAKNLLHKNLEKETRTFVQNAIIAVVRTGLTDILPADGIDIQTMLSDNTVVETLVRNATLEIDYALGACIQSRTEQILKFLEVEATK